VNSTWIARRLAVTACLLGSWSLVSAQAVRSRILEDINPNNTVVLPGSVSPRIAPQFQIGHMAASTPIDGITLTFALTPEQKAELDALVKAQLTPGNPEFHQWLTPAQYAARFGISEADVQKVEQWLESQGFNVERVANSRMSIAFSGTVEQVETTFQTQMNQYRVDGGTHWSNATKLSIPAALQGVVLSVGNLNDFRPHPMMRPALGNSANTRPAFTSSESGYDYMTPGDVATVYDITPAYSLYDGKGVTIAIMGQSAIEASDIQNFDSAAGLSFNDPTMILVPGSGSSVESSGDEAESDLDTEYSGAIANGANIDFVYVGNNENYSVFDSLHYAVDNNIGSIISISYGACEEGFDSATFSGEEQILEEGAAQGQTIIASAGDSGSTACYGYSSLTTAEQEALAVNYPASSDYATGVGGTEFPSADVNAGTGTGANSSEYWNTSNSSNGSSALMYIPETAWNDDVTCGSYATTSNDPGAAICSGGGGVSAYASRPSWQTGVNGIPSGSMRLVPDLSLDSSNVIAPYLFCTSDQSAWSSGQQASCNSGFRDSASQDLTAAGGTSFAAPIFAGMMAIIDQKTGSSQGIAAAELYKLDGSTPSAFHDITTGGNNCTAGSSYCSGAALNDYLTTTGYDEATGLGSVDFNSLLKVWTNSSGFEPSSITTATAANSTVTAGSSDTITISVASASSTITTTPTGTLTILVDGTTETSSLPLANGSATYSYTTTSATLNGTHTIEAIYSGDSNFAGSSDTILVTVTGGTSPESFALSASPTTVSVTEGSSGTSTITITSQGAYAGTVDFTLSTTSTVLETYGCAAINNTAVAANGTATATLTLYTSESACSGASLRRSPRAFIRFGNSGGAAQNRSPFGGAVPIGASALAGLLLFGLRRQRSKLGTMLGCLMLAVALGSFATGCGGGSGTGTGTGGSNDVPPGSYSVTVTGTDSVNSSITTSVNLTLQVTS
jgi:subtilase family serine protease